MSRLRSGEEGGRSQTSRWRWHLDEVFVSINGCSTTSGERGPRGEVLESYVTRTRDKAAALRFLRKLMKRHGGPRSSSPMGCAPTGGPEGGWAEHRQVTGRWENTARELDTSRSKAREGDARPAHAQPSEVRLSPWLSAQPLQRRASLTDRATYKRNRTAALAEWRGSAPA
jgi:putative transposase